MSTKLSHLVFISWPSILFRWVARGISQGVVLFPVYLTLFPSSRPNCPFTLSLQCRVTNYSDVCRGLLLCQTALQVNYSLFRPAIVGSNSLWACCVLVCVPFTKTCSRSIDVFEWSFGVLCSSRCGR